MYDTSTQLLKGESELEYLWRLGNLKNDGIIDLGWEDVALLINKAFKDEENYLGSSAYRKRYTAARQFYDEIFSKQPAKERVSELDEKIRELEVAKIQFRDERNSWQRQNYLDARVTNDLNYLGEQLKEIGKVSFQIEPSIKITSDKSMILMLSDWHIGQCFNSVFGEYNSDLATERINTFLNKAIEIGKINNVESVYCALLGDEISGNNHLSIQVSNRENLIEQVKVASELISSFCVELSKVFNSVHVYGIAGNHSRVIADRNKDIKDERLDSLITWIVSKITDHIDNIHVYCESLDSTMTKMTVRGKSYVLTHGDMTGTSDSDIGKLALALGELPYAILCGHRHSPMYKEFNNIKFVQSGSLASAGDDYTISKRLTGKANQTILIVDSNGIQSINNIELS